MMSQFKSSLRDASFFLGETMVPKSMRTTGVIGALRRQVIYWARDSFVLSYPKCGRTWLRTMIGHVMDRHYDLHLDNPMEIQHFWKISSKIPCIGFSHDDGPNLKTATAIQTDKSQYRRKNILFLARDPRDVVVSYYFDARYRMKIFDGTINEFLRQDVGSIDSIVRFYNVWAKARHDVKSFQLLTYEEMHTDPSAALATALHFLGIHSIPGGLIEEAIAFGAFQNLRKIEQSDAFGHERMRPADRANPDSFKVRRGKAGGYVDYFDTEEVAYLDQRIDALDPLFAMYKRPVIPV